MATETEEQARRRERRRAWWRRAALLAILLGAGLVRSRDASTVFSQGRVLPPGTDSYYHLRRIQKAVETFPHVPSFDAYLNYPEGARIYWPAGFDLALAGVARLAGAQAWTADVERICAWTVPALGILVVLATWWAGMVWRGRAVGLVAAAVAAAAPSAVSRSAVGRVDHDVLVILLATLAYACCIAALRAEGRRARLAWAIAAGTLLGGNLWVWPGAILFVLVAAAFFLVQSVAADLAGRAATRGLDVALATTGAAAALVAVLCLLSPAARPGEASLAFLSRFQIALALAGVLSALALWTVLRIGRLGRWPRLGAVAVTQLLAAALALMVVPGAWREVRGALEFVGRRTDIVVASAGEARGLLDNGVSDAGAGLTWAVAALPLALLAVIWRAVRTREPAGDWLIAVWAVALSALAVGQRRFAAYLAVPMALAVAALASWAWAAAAAAPSRTRRICRVSLAVVAAAAIVSPWTRWGPQRDPSSTELERVLPALDWLRTKSAPGGDIRDFEAKPPYAVMAYWHYGHWLTYLGQRANIACPFGNTPQHQLGLLRSCEFFGARSEDEAADLCRRLGVRYILSTDFFLPVIFHDLGLAWPPEQRVEIMAMSLQLRPRPLAPGTHRPLRHFRLVVEFVDDSPEGPRFVTRLFEFLPGQAS